MFIKKLFFFTSILFVTIATVLPENPEPEEIQQSTTQYIKDNLATIVLYLTMRIQTTFNHSIDYIKSFFWRKTAEKYSEATKDTSTAMIPKQPQDAEKALAVVAQDLTIIQSSFAKSFGGHGKTTEGKSSLVEAMKNKTQKTKIEKIDSPAIDKEKAETTRKQLATLVQHVKELDMIIAQLPATEWPLWQEKTNQVTYTCSTSIKTCNSTKHT